MTHTPDNKLLHPAARLTLLEDIQATLYVKTRKRITKVLEDLIRDNSAECGNDQKVMSHLGQIYLRGKRPTEKLNAPINMVHKLLKQRMDTYLLSVEKVNQEESFTLGYIRKLMAQTSHADDLYKLLPSSLHSNLSKFDRLFFSGDGKLSEQSIISFQKDNNKYIRMVKARLAYNLLDVGEV